MESTDKHIVYLALGSNIGDSKANLICALHFVEKRIGIVTTCSSFFITEPFGFESENQFSNAACCVTTLLSPKDLLSCILTIEKEMGRSSKSINGSYADRIIDIDILMYDDLVLSESPSLVIPHPKMQERLFVLDPLCEIAPTLIHPVLHKSVAELRAALLN